MITEKQISGFLDIDTAPPSKATIAGWRKSYARAKPFEPGSVSHAIAFQPIPITLTFGLELIPALAVAAVESAVPDPVGDILADCPVATGRDWGTGATAVYVDKVKALGRPLIFGEVAMLSAHSTISSGVASGMVAGIAALSGKLFG